MVSRRTLVLAVAVPVAALAAAGGVALTSLVSPSRPPGSYPAGPTAVPTAGYTVYTAPGDILFDVNSYDLRPEALPVLRAVAAKLATGRRDGTVLVEGYTDDVGSDDYNRALAQRRADTVAAWLEANAGVAHSRIRTTAFGRARPAQPNDTDAHRQANRRVVIRAEQ